MCPEVESEVDVPRLKLVEKGAKAVFWAGKEGRDAGRGKKEIMIYFRRMLKERDKTYAQRRWQCYRTGVSLQVH